MKKITETRCTCLSCDKIWHYDKKEEMQYVGNALQEVGKAGLCCTGCLPALFIHKKPIKDFNKCPNCGSKAIKKERIVHEVK